MKNEIGRSHFLGVNIIQNAFVIKIIAIKNVENNKVGLSYFK